MYLKTEPESEGCGTQPDPEVVPFEERERLFKFSFELADVVIEPVDEASCFGDVANPFEDGSSADADAFEDAAADLDADLGEVDQNPQDSGVDAAVDAGEDADASSR